MANADGKDPRGDSEEQDTDEQFADHPELAPSEGRIPVERIKDLEAEAHRRAEAGDAVDDAGDRHHKLELNFALNQDFAGDEASLPTDADYSRGSGYIGGKLEGEEHSGESNPVGIRPMGFDSSLEQERNREAILREEEESVGDWSAHPPDPESAISQGRDIRHPDQVTGIQAFGRDVGATGLDQEDREEQGTGPARTPPSPEHKLWASVLRRLGGSSPGSEENLQLSDRFSRVQFPADRNGVINRIEPGAEFRIREGISVDLKEAVEHSRLKLFRNLGDLVDCVKDELRRQEAAGIRLMKTA